MLAGRVFRQAFLLPKHTNAVLGELDLDLERADVRQAFIIPRPGKRVVVRIEKKNRLTPPVHLEFQSEEDARALVRALGVDAESVAAEMSVANVTKTPASLTGQIVIIAVAILFLATLTSYFFLGTSLSLLGALNNLFITAWLSFLFLNWFVPPRVRIGVDGVLARSWFRKDLVRFSNVQRARIYDVRASGTTQYGVILTLVDVRLPCVSRLVQPFRRDNDT